MGRGHAPGISCPECNTHITVDIAGLLALGKVVCHNCKLELIINQEKSAESIGVLKELDNNLSDAQNHFNKSQYTTPTRRKPAVRGRRREVRKVRRSS